MSLTCLLPYKRTRTAKMGAGRRRVVAGRRGVGAGKRGGHGEMGEGEDGRKWEGRKYCLGTF